MRCPLAVVAGLAAALWLVPAALADTTVTIGFDGPPAVVGQSPENAYPGIRFNPVGDPLGGCGSVVFSLPNATVSPPNAVRFPCSGELPKPSVLLALLTSSSTRAVSVAVGDYAATPSSPVTVVLEGFDAGNQLVASSPPVAITGPPQTLSIATTTPVMTRFRVRQTAPGLGSPSLWADDVRYDVPATAPPPDFALTGGAGGILYLEPGGPAAVRDLAVTRLNGSTGQVTWTASGLPAGVSFAITPTQTGGRLELSASASAAATPDPVTITVTATPANAQAGSAPRSVTIQVSIGSLLWLETSGNVQTVTVPRCEPLLLRYGVSSRLGEASFRFSPALPKELRFELDDDRVQGYGTARLTLRVTGGLFKPWSGTVKLVAGNRVASVPLTVTRSVAYVSLRTLEASTRMGSIRESDVVVEAKGFRFCDRVVASFGGAAATVQAASVSTDRTTAVFRLPRLAVPGIVTVTTANAAGGPVFTSTSTNRLGVRTYRSLVGLPFRNLGLGFDFADFERAFGPKRIFWVIPDPFWLTVFTAVNGFLSGKGVCFGMSLAGLELRANPGLLADFPPQGRTAPFDLDGPGGPSNPLEQMIRANQLKVISHQISDAYLTGAVQNLKRTTTQWADLVRGSFTGGRFPVISLRQGTDRQAMHVVVPYDVRAGESPGEFLVDVYDSNMPYVEAEDEDFGTHVERVEKSVLHVRPDGSWDLKSSDYSGATLGSIVVVPPYHLTGPWTLNALEGLDKIVRFLNLPEDPKRSPAASGAGGTASRVAGVTVDGRALAGGRDGIQVAGRVVSVPWVIPAGLRTVADGRLVRAPRGADVELRLAGSRPGLDRRLLIAPGLTAEVVAATGPGEVDRLRLGGDGSVGFVNGGRSSPLTVRLASEQGRAVELRTTAPAGASDTVSLIGGSVRITHAGPPTTATLVLSGSADGVPVSVTTAPVRLGAGTTLVRPRSWSTLGRTALTVSVGGRTRPLAARRLALPPATVLGARAVGSGRARSVDVRLRTPRAARGSLLVVRLGRGASAPGAVATASGGVQTVRVPVGARRLAARLEVVVATARRAGAGADVSVGARSLALARGAR